MGEHILEHFIKNNLPDVVDYSDITKELVSKGNLEPDDKIVYYIRSSSFKNNAVLFSLKKVIFVDRGTGSGDVEYDYKSLITFKIVQHKLFFSKMDLSVTPSYDRDYGGGGSAFYVNKKYADAFKLMYSNILTMMYPDLFNVNTDWERQMAQK